MDKIQLANCHITQITTKGAKGPWTVKDQKGNIIAELPADLDEHEAMAIIHFARKFELKAFNTGINFAKGLNKAELVDGERTKLMQVIKELTLSHDLLAEKYNKFTREN